MVHYRRTALSANKMRLWSLHPSLLDSRGLVALWRESLLAQKVLNGETQGYRFHPQLDRFRTHGRPADAIATYLWGILKEATARGYRFDSSRILRRPSRIVLPVTTGQMDYEMEHLQKKLSVRDPNRFKKLRQVRKAVSHPIFKIVPGPVEPWEVIRR
jgi:hypothetical protein